MKPAFKKCQIKFWPKYKNISMTDEPKHIEMMKDIVPGWSGVAKFNISNLSGAGGASLYMFKPADQTVKPWGAVIKIEKPSRRLQAIEPANEEIISLRTNDAICAFERNGKITLGKLAEGNNWFVQLAMGVEEEKWDHRYPPKMIGDLSARIHSTPTLWAQRYVDILEKKFPQLKNYPKGSAVWSWAKYALNAPEVSGIWEAIGKLEAKINYLENDPKTSYTVHGDWHGYNMMYTDKSHTEMRAIDLDETWIGSPLVDMSRHMWLEGWNFEARHSIITAWLAKRGVADKDGSKAISWLMDAEIYKLLNNIDGIFIQDLKKCTLAQKPLSRGSSRTPQPKDGEALLSLVNMWNHASKEKLATLELITMGIFEYASQHSTDSVWTDYRDSECGQSIPSIQKGFGVKHTVGNENLYVEGGDAKKVLKALSDFQTVLKLVPGTITKKDKGGMWKSIIDPKADKEQLEPYFNKVTKVSQKKSTGRTFYVAGGTRKSGYPYGLSNGNLLFKVTQVSSDTVWINFKLKGWQQMALQYPEYAGELQLKSLVGLYTFALNAKGLTAPSG